MAELKNIPDEVKAELLSLADELERHASERMPVGFIGSSEYKAQRRGEAEAYRTVSRRICALVGARMQ